MVTDKVPQMNKILTDGVHQLPALGQTQKMDQMLIDEEFNDELIHKVDEEINGLLQSFWQDIENISHSSIYSIYDNSYSEEELEQIKNHFKELITERVKENL